MATWFTIIYEGEPTEADYARVAELAAQGFTSGQLVNDEPVGTVWLESLTDASRLGPYRDEIDASEAMDALGLSDSTYKIVVREPDDTDCGLADEEATQDA